MSFENFANAINENFNEMAKGNLYKVVCGKDEIFAEYLASFPEGINPIYKERTEHDCQCCKHYIRDIGAVVSIKDGKLKSIWNIDFKDDIYGKVAQAVRIRRSYKLESF